MADSWTMSTAGMRVPGAMWPGSAASFIVMWDVMMVAMMMPALMPMLLRHRRAVSAVGEKHVELLTVMAGAGYFMVWTVFGIAVHTIGVVLVAMEIRLPALARAIPLAIGSIVLVAGLLQFTAWKAHYLACCRTSDWSGNGLAGAPISSLLYGLRLGLHCTCSCIGLTAILLAFGIMDLRAMAAVTAAISLERLARNGQRAARAIGAVAASAGVFLIARAAGLG